MKTKALLLALITMLFTNEIKTHAQTPGSEKKVLIVYYSLRNGNTRIVAEHIQKNVGGNIFRIETVDAYPAEYRDVTDQAKKRITIQLPPTTEKQSTKLRPIRCNLSRIAQLVEHHCPCRNDFPRKLQFRRQNHRTLYYPRRQPPGSKC